MSKRALKKYVAELPKEELKLQLLDLYERFSDVKTYYDFIFNPKEDKLVQEAKTKISNEYFPVKRKRPKARRSVAQKYIKHFFKLGMEPSLVADVMCFNLEIAQTFAMARNVPDSFYKSMSNSFSEMTVYISQHGLLVDFKERMLKIYEHTQNQTWPFEEDFSRALDILD
ncbi:MAG: hypothetical protein ACJAUQ_001485 [Maribacter sp.]|jgi:hypothetical protein